MRRRVAVVLALFVLAGCLGPLGTPGTDDTPARTERNPAKSSTDAAPQPANPWGKSTLTVGVIHSNGSWRNVTGSVADALGYWEQHDSRYGRYEVDFELQPNAADPDVVVRYVTDVSVCGSPTRDRGAGFAPRITAEHPPQPPEYVCVRTGFNEASTVHILEHEFGHLLGIEHGGAPEDLMRADYEYLQVPRPAPALSAAWAPRDHVSVFVDRSTIFARRDYVAGRQLERVFDYYESGAAETIGRVTITETEDRAAADVVIRFPRQSPCDRPLAGSCSKLVERPDGRPQLDVSITTTHEDTFGWHAGFWLGFALGADRHEQLPAPFRNASFDDRSRQWWSEAS